MATAIGRGGTRVKPWAADTYEKVLSVGALLWYAARTHKVALHRGSVRGMVTGALLIAGFFTFPFGRLLGRWLVG